GIRIRAASTALEIVACGGMAEWRPAVHAPVIDKAQAAHMRLEPLGLAHRGQGGVPDQRQLAKTPEALLSFAFIKLKSAFGSANMKVNPAELAKRWKVLRLGRPHRCCAQSRAASFEKALAGIFSKKSAASP